MGALGRSGSGASPFTNTEITDPSCAGFVGELTAPSAFIARATNPGELLVGKVRGPFTTRAGFADMRGNARAERTVSRGILRRVSDPAGDADGAAIDISTGEIVWLFGN